jgi:hypothetical protein
VLKSSTRRRPGALKPRSCCTSGPPALGLRASRMLER